MENTLFEGISDEELIEMMRKGDKNVEDFLLDKYKNLVKKRARALFLIGADTDDLIQEGMIGLYKAIRDFDIGKEVTFYTFADVCIKNQIYNAIQGSNRLKHAPLNSYISFSNLSSNANDEMLNNPENLLISRENSENLIKEFKKQLSEYENKVIMMYIDGNSYVEIAQKLGKTPKSVDNALTRIKKKIMEIVEKSKLD